MIFRRRKQQERDLDREVRAHLELEAQELGETGLAGGDARNAARRAFGNATLVMEDTRYEWGFGWTESLGKDLRYAARTLRANPGFAATAILSLALGIGANTAIFSLLDALLLRFLPVPNAAELVQARLVEMGRPGSSFGYPSIGALASREDIFAGVTGFSAYSFDVGTPEGSERITGALVTGGYYDTLGVRPFAGRLLQPEDDRPGAPAVAVLSYAYWGSRFGRDFGAVGSSLSLEGRPVTIVGISPRGFEGANVGTAANLTLALGVLPQLFPERAANLESGPQWLRVLARPAAGLSIAEANARLAAAWPQMAAIATTPQMNPKRRDVILHSAVDLVPGSTGWSGWRDQFRSPLLVLLALTGLVLLIACANFANLLLARGAARSREIALRFAIGAGRSRIVRQLLTESVLLSVLGALSGLGLAGIASRLLVKLLSAGQREAMQLDLSLDARVLLFTSAVALSTGVLFGLAPALRATASGPAPVLKGAASGQARSRVLPAMVVCQVALSLALLIGAGLFVRTLQNLQQVDPGFRSEGVLIVNVDGRRAGYKDVRLAALYQELRDRFARLPGVRSVSVSDNTPLNNFVWSTPVSINGQPPTKEAAHFNSVSQRYFETLGTPMILGRDFEERDRPGAAGAAIVNETFVRRYLAGASPIGQRLAVEGPRYPAGFEIVGVVRDTLLQNLRQAPPPAAFIAYWQYPEQMSAALFEVRVDGSLTATVNRIRAELLAKLPSAPQLSEIHPFDDQVRRTLTQERTLAALGSCFGALALLLAAVGLYGLLAYTVTRTTNEIGIRMALGAQRDEVLRMIFGNAVRLLALGTVVGVPIAWAGSRLVNSMLFGLTATDPVTMVGAIVLMGTTAAMAALVPALRASRIDPMVALRYE